MLTGLFERQFRTLVVGLAADRGGQQCGAGRRWGWPLADRVLLVAVYYRTNLTLRQVVPLFGVSKSAAGRIVEHLAGYLVLAHVEGQHPSDTVLIVDGTLVPTHDRNLSARSKNYRNSASLQVVIDANTRLTVAVGEPLPGNRNNTRAYTESSVKQHAGARR